MPAAEPLGVLFAGMPIRFYNEALNEPDVTYTGSAWFPTQIEMDDGTHILTLTCGTDGPSVQYSKMQVSYVSGMSAAKPKAGFLLSGSVPVSTVCHEP